MKILLKLYILILLFLCCFSVIAFAHELTIVCDSQTNEYTLTGKTDSGTAEAVSISVTVNAPDVYPLYASFVFSDSNGNFSHRFFLPTNIETGYLYLNCNTANGEKKSVRFLHTKKAPYVGVIVKIPNTSFIMDKENAEFYVYAYQNMVNSESCTIEYSLDSFNTSVSSVITVPNGIRTVQPISLRHLNKGVYNLSVRVTRQGGAVIEKTEKIGIISHYNNQPLDNFSSIGVHVAMIPGQVNTASIQLMKYAGIKQARPVWIMNWARAETTKGVYNIEIMQSILFNPLQNAGISCYGGIEGVNNLYGGYPVDDQSILGWSNAAVAFSPYIDIIEVQNEPNLSKYYSGTVEDYSNLVKTAATAIHAQDANKIVTAGVVSSGNYNYLTQMFDQGVYPYIDAVSFHPYYVGQWSKEVNDGDYYKTWVKNHMQPQKNYGGWLDTYISENGWYVNGAYGLTEEEQARSLVIGHLIDLQVGVNKTFFYQLHNAEDSTNDFGILDSQKKVRPAYIALSQMTNQLNNAFYIGCISLGNNIKAHIFNKLGKPLMVAYCQKDTVDSYSFNEEMIEACDYYGNPLQIINGCVEFGENPVYISGLDESWMRMAVAEEARKCCTMLEEEIGENVDSEIFNELSDAIDSIDGQEEPLLMKIYETGSEIMEQYQQTAFCSIEKLSNLLWELHLTAKKVAEVCTSTDISLPLEHTYYSGEMNGISDVFAQKISRRSQMLLRDAEVFRSEEGINNFAIQHAQVYELMSTQLDNWANQMAGLSDVYATVMALENNGDYINAKVQIENSTYDPCSLLMIIAVYEADNKLAALHLEPIEANIGIGEFTALLSNGDYNGKRINLMVWNNIEELRPIEFR